MKLKSWILWLPVVAFLASVGFLFLANREKVAALDSARESKQRADDLQAQLDQLKSSIADSQSAEVSRLRADNQDLPRLRNEVTQLQAANLNLQAANQKLTQQLQAILATAQQQQAQLEQDVAEKQQVRETVQAAADVLAADARNSCINNLRQIDAAKNEWALENNKPAGTILSEQDISEICAEYIKGGVVPVCPSGGTYSFNAIGEPPSCSVHGVFQP
jgi:septal ring factor EnvC (AmiA/AmiB activator)